MDSFNNNFKSFDDEQTDLPEGFGWDDMKEGVYEKMPFQKRRRRVAAWWWFGSAGIVALSFAAWLLLSGDSASTIGLATSEISNSSSEARKENSTSTAHESIVLNESQQTTIETVLESSGTRPVIESSQANNNQVELEKPVIAQRQIKSIKVRANQSESAEILDARRKLDYAANTTSSNKERLNDSTIEAKPNMKSSLENTTVVKATSSGLATAAKATQQVNSAIAPSQETRNNPINTLRKKPLILTELRSASEKELIVQRDAEKLPGIEVISLSPEEEDNLSHFSLLKLFNPKSPVPASNSIFIETLVSVPTSKISAINAPYIKPWYALGQNIGYQRQMKNRFGFSAHYTHLVLKQEFTFSDLDTITRQQPTSAHTINYVNSELSLLASTTVTAGTQFERQRDVLSYNIFEINQFSLFAHYMVPLDSKRNLDFGLGGSIAFLSSAEGIRLDETGELVALANAYDFGNNRFGSINTRVRYVEQFSPRLAWTLGLNYMQTLQGNGPRSIDMVNSASFMMGMRWNF